MTSPFAAKLALSRLTKNENKNKKNERVIAVQTELESNLVKSKKGLSVDVTKLLPDELDGGRKVVKLEIDDSKVELYVKKHAGQGGHDSKHFVLNRYLKLDDFFFENLGLWQGDGGKFKGLYFGNSCQELLLHFIKFSENIFGIKRNDFKVTINSPLLQEDQDAIKERWSKILKIPFENFTKVCFDTRINNEYAQIYINGIVLSEVINNLHEKLKLIILSNKAYSASYIRGIFASEGQVALKKWGTIAYVAITSEEKNLDWYTSCLSKLGIIRGKHQLSTLKFPIYGRRNLEKFRLWKIHSLHPNKKRTFEYGIENYQRDIMKGEEMEKLILKQLNPEPKTYDEIAKALNKGRSTIQSHYIPILEKKGLIKRIGKRKQAWLFSITEIGKEILNV